jgi:hypothetical protein
LTKIILYANNLQYKIDRLNGGNGNQKPAWLSTVRAFPLWQEKPVFPDLKPIMDLCWGPGMARGDRAKVD